MKHRVNIVTALVLAACAVPAAQAADLRAPGGGSHSVPAVHFNGLANLGHEGSGLVGHKNRVKLQAAPASNVFANLGHEGSGLEAAYAAASIRPWAN